ncbi:Ig-like domain-containing protein [Trueperella pyogenes]|uniref:Ig-like domain-containing protein n=1 Tax=Trueperella pyogenes TaxID=1661 RepID=UPI00345D35C6
MRLSLKAKTLSLVATLMMALSTLAWLPSPAASANGCGGSGFEAFWESGSLEDGNFVARAGQSATFKAKWGVPATVKPNDTYTITLPDELRTVGTPDYIEAKDDTGEVVATGKWSGKTITFTYGKYVAEKENVRVSFHQEVTWDDRFNTKNDDEDFTGRLGFTDACNSVKYLNGKFLGTPSGTKPAAGKSGYLPYQDVESSDGLGGYDRLKLVEWSIYATGYLESMPGDSRWLSWSHPDYFVIEDKIPAGQKIICADAGQVKAPKAQWLTAMNYELNPVSDSVAKIECSEAANTLKVTIDLRENRERKGDHILVKLFTETDDATPGKKYYNEATATISRYGGQQQPQETKTVTYKAQAKRAGWGAEGEGEEGFGNIALKKDVVGVDSALNQKYVFNVSCLGRTTERVELKSGEYRYIKRIPKGTQCMVTEVDPPQINGTAPTVSYTVDGQPMEKVQFNIQNRATVHVQAVNTYTQPPTKLVVQKKIDNNGRLTADSGWKFTADVTGAKLGQPAEQITDSAGTASWTINHESAAVATIKVGEDLQSKEGFAFKSATCEVTEANKSTKHTVNFDAVSGTLAEVKPGSRITCEFVNQPSQGTVEWVKHDIAGELLSGSEWTLTGKNSAPITVTDCVSQAPEQCEGPDKDPRGGAFKVEKLAWGDYTLTEALAPAGYLRDSTEHSFTIEADSNVVKLGPFVNVKVGGPHIPLTGGLGRDAFIFGGALVLAVGAFVVGRSLLHGKTAA